MQEDATKVATDTFDLLSLYVPKLVGAALILVVGWVVALLIARGVRAGLRRTGVSRRITTGVSAADADSSDAFDLWVSRGVFYLLMLFVLVGFFQVLGLSQITEPLSRFLNEIFGYAPRLIGPAVLLIVAWLTAKFLKMLVQRGLAASKLERRIAEEADPAAPARAPISQTVGETIYWLTFLIFLPAILSSLDLGGLLEPVRGVVNELLGYLPNLFAAGLILVIGWFVARILRRVVTNLLAAAGSERLSERVGLGATFGEQKLSGFVGLVVYVLVFVPVLVAALNALELDAVTRPASAMLNAVLASIPHIFAGALVLIVAYVVGRIVSGLVTGLLAGSGFDAIPARLGFGESGVAGGRKLSDVTGFLLMTAIMLFATVEAMRLVGFDALATLVSGFLVFAARILIGVVVIGLGMFIAKIVGEAVKAANPPQASLLSWVARAAILVLAFAMGLEQMDVGEDIISLAFGLTLGAIAVAAAISFGLGGRDAAADVVAGWMRKLPAAKDRPEPPFRH